MGHMSTCYVEYDDNDDDDDGYEKNEDRFITIN
jgi:hypothetical protein